MLSRAQEKPEYLDYARSRQADCESITAPDLDALAAEYPAPARAAKFIITPKAN